MLLLTEKFIDRYKYSIFLLYTITLPAPDMVC